jgi:hypothetical protein
MSATALRVRKSAAVLAHRRDDVAAPAAISRLGWLIRLATVGGLSVAQTAGA